MLRNILLVAIGGAIGSVCRYLLQMALYLGASVVIGILAVWLGMNVSDTIK